MDSERELAYVLGIDLGTSYTAAAVGRPDGRVEIFQLGQRGASIPSLVVVRADGEVLVGEAAERRSLTEPARTAREFKRRLGDPVPIILGGTPYGPDALIAALLRSVVAQVGAELGGPPSQVVITHPASYGPYKLDLLQQAARQADLAEVSFVSEPVAAAVHYASLEHVPDGATIAVYDFGGGTFDATVLRTTAAGFEVLGTPEGLERLGGVDFDEAIFRHVIAALGARAAALDASDPAVAAGLARLREECRRAKEALSADSDVAIPVSLPGIQTEVRLTRPEFEAMIEPRIAETVAALGRAGRSASIDTADIDRVLFVGGTSRIPRIAERVHAVTGRPIKVDVHPKHSVALGAARLGLARLVAEPATSEPVVAAAGATPPSDPTPVAVAPMAAARPPARADATSRADSASARRWLVPAVVGALLVAGLGAVLAGGLLGGGQGALTGATASPGGTSLVVGPTLPPAPTALPLPSAVTPSAGTAPSARITGVALVGGRYEVAFATSGFTPSMGGQHVHFFWNTVPPDRAGEPAGGPYAAYDGGSPFVGFAPAVQPGGATAVCITVANVDHTVVLDSGNCMPVP